MILLAFLSVYKIRLSDERYFNFLVILYIHVYLFLFQLLKTK